MTKPPTGKPDDKPKISDVEIANIIHSISTALHIEIRHERELATAIRRLVETGKIQGLKESLGDKEINRYVDARFPYTGNGSRNDMINTLLKSNWFLSRIYSEIGIKLDSHKFINEKIYRHGKRNASLFEWLIGHFFINMGGAINKPKFVASARMRIQQILDRVMLPIISDDKELEKEWMQFKDQQKKR